ncbi:hypothetical protein [Nocardioides sp. B-3]|uniref:hypothetical protein n=1 Tax=Nocardioides sp. B-3 TaxID=2895565 RepID=UPI0021531DDA|nr:hypothetical protein [Nocardioides sp. B-3]UUZ59781.1 hypothetical protein LP418_01375 [Nocardioides sp. B-3]
MSSPPVPTSRRTALALALSAPLVLAACELDPPSAVPTEAPAAEPLPDAEVAASARKAILLTVASIEAAGVRHPRLAAGLDPWLALHAAHLAVLDDGSEAFEVEGEIPASTAGVARDRVVAPEGSLAGALADAARRAASGDWPARWPACRPPSRSG